MAMCITATLITHGHVSISVHNHASGTHKWYLIGSITVTKRLSVSSSLVLCNHVNNHSNISRKSMALLGKVRYDEYEVKMSDDVGNIRVEYVLAPDVERAAWQAMELSSQRNLLLKDVRMCDEW